MLKNAVSSKENTPTFRKEKSMLQIYLSMVETPEEQSKAEYLYNKYKPLMFHCAMKILRNETEAQDAVHNAFIYILKNKEKYLCLDDTNFRNWCVVLVESKSIDALRKQGRKIPLEEAESLPSGDLPLNTVLENREQFLALDKAIDSMDAEGRLVFEMKHILKMSYEQIRDATGFDKNKTDNILRRTKKKLRASLEVEKTLKNFSKNLTNFRSSRVLYNRGVKKLRSYHSFCPLKIKKREVLKMRKKILAALLVTACFAGSVPLAFSASAAVNQEVSVQWISLKTIALGSPIRAAM
jgi:RNA polymerase sigma-70 factor (ECF subfamily)